MGYTVSRWKYTSNSTCHRRLISPSFVRQPDVYDAQPHAPRWTPQLAESYYYGNAIFITHRHPLTVSSPTSFPLLSSVTDIAAAGVRKIQGSSKQDTYYVYMFPMMIWTLKKVESSRFCSTHVLCRGVISAFLRVCKVSNRLILNFTRSFVPRRCTYVYYHVFNFFFMYKL